jgi:hypothetical protein
MQSFVNKTLEGMWNGRFWSHFKYYLGIFPERLGKIRKTPGIIGLRVEIKNL